MKRKREKEMEKKRERNEEKRVWRMLNEKRVEELNNFMSRKF